MPGLPRTALEGSLRILVASTAGSGHFGPLVPFAEACRRAGHEVLVAAPRSFEPVVDRAGFDFWACDDLPHAEWQSVMDRLPNLTPDEASKLVFGEVFGRLDTRAVLPGMLAAFESWHPDLVLREPCELGSSLAAERNDVPQVRVGIGLGMVDDLATPLLAGGVAELRESVGLSADPGGQGLRSAPFLTLVPPSFEDPSAPGPPHAARFRRLPPEASPEPLPRWWPDDGPLVYVTLGSVTAGIPRFRDVYRRVVEALVGLPVRILVTVGDGADPDDLVGGTPANVHVERWVPQARVAAEATLIVSHGGFNTVLGALEDGLPHVVVPLFADQPQNARRVAAVGAGIAVDGGPPDGQAVHDAVRRVLDDGSYGEAAVRIAQEIRGLPVADESVPTLEALAAR